MKRILLGFRALMDEELRPRGVTTAQMQILFAIRSAPASSGAQLARNCYVTPQTAQAFLRHLEDAGLIVRGKDPVNDRIVTANITAAGERLVQAVEKKSATLQGRLWREVPDRDLQQLNKLLERCLGGLGETD